MALEMCVVGLALFGLLRMDFRIMRDMQKRIEVSNERLREIEAEARLWREQVANVKPGLEEGLARQFAIWKLTEAEEAIARPDPEGTHE